jgi:hypothetical protein
MMFGRNTFATIVFSLLAKPTREFSYFVPITHIASQLLSHDVSKKKQQMFLFAVSDFSGHIFKIRINGI